MVSENKKVEYSTLKRYFEGQTSEEDSGLITSWLEDSESGFKCEKYLHQLWNDLDPENRGTETDLESLLDKIHHSIHLKSCRQTKVRRLSQDHKPSFNVNRLLQNLGRIAAIFLVPVMGYIGWEIYSQKMWMEHQA